MLDTHDFHNRPHHLGAIHDVSINFPAGTLGICEVEGAIHDVGINIPGGTLGIWEVEGAIHDVSINFPDGTLGSCEVEIGTEINENPINLPYLQFAIVYHATSV